MTMHRNPPVWTGRRALLIGLFLSASLLASAWLPRPAAAQTPPGVESPDTLLEEADREVTHGLAELGAALASPVWSDLIGYLDRQFNIVTATQPAHTTDFGPVRSFYATARSIANAALALLIMFGAYRVMLRGGLADEAVSLPTWLFRLGLAACLANTGLIGDGGWLRWAIDVNNGLIDAAAGALLVSMPPTVGRMVGAETWLAYLTVPVTLPTTFLAGLALVLVLSVVIVLWLIQLVIRLALLNLLIVLAPIAMVLDILPATSPWAALWRRLFVATLFTQAAQFIVLMLAFKLFGSVTLFSLSGSAWLAPLLSIASVVLLLKVPSLMGAGYRTAQSIGGAAGSTLRSVAAGRRLLGV